MRESQDVANSLENGPSPVNADSSGNKNLAAAFKNGTDM